MNIKVLGIDLAKNVFQLCALLEDGSMGWNRKAPRLKLLDKVRQLPSGTLIAMEACASAHYWGRTFMAMGFQVKLIPAQDVKPFVRCQKNDAHDALAICEAAFRPSIHSVAVKSVEQQDIKALRCVRRRLVEQRTAISNQLRGLAAEYGVIFPQGILKLQQALPEALGDAENGLSHIARDLLYGLHDEIRLLNNEVDTITAQIIQLCKQQPRYKALLSVPGFGPIIAAALLSEVGTGEQFSNGRQLSAWCGLVPSQYSSGGKTRLGSITKHGNRELRTLLIHGARAVIRFAENRKDDMGRWLMQLIERRGKKKAIVALANKLTRIAWCILNRQESFDARLAFKPLQ